MLYRCAEQGRRSAQGGVALITVLLVFVLATMMATHMLRTGYVAMHRTGNLINSTQARYYAYGAEELGRDLLSARTGPAAQAVDHLGQEWASENLRFEIDEGVLELQISDQAGRFNLNSLIDASGKSDPQAVARFGRLLQQLHLDQNLALVVADWIDSDEQTARGGSESSTYRAASIPNRPLVESGELQAVPGFEGETWKQLRELVSAVPPGTLLNLNTAPARVLAAYSETASLADMERFVHTRKLQPLKSTQDPAIASLFANVADRVAVKSDFFMINAHAEYRGRHVRLNTLMQRDARTGKISILGRSDAARL